MKKLTAHFFFIITLLALFLLFPFNLVHAEVSITNLGTLGGSYGVARGINDNGQVTGVGSQSDETVSGFLWFNGAMTDLAAAAPWEINSNGYITGQNNDYGGFVWHNGTLTTIDGNILGGNYSALLDINSNNKAMGIANNGNGEYHAFTWDNGTVTDLGIAESLSGIDGGINNNDEVIAGHTLWHNGQTTDIGFAGFKINNNGYIVGEGSKIWHNGTITQMTSSLSGFTIASGNNINDKNQVVGVGLTSDGKWHGYIWKNGVTTVLGTLGGNYSDAYDINENGQIVGTATDAIGNYHPVMWTLPTLPQTKQDCKKDNWNEFSNSFKNQGDCIKSLNIH